MLFLPMQSPQPQQILPAADVYTSPYEFACLSSLITLFAFASGRILFLFLSRDCQRSALGRTHVCASRLTNQLSSPIPSNLEHKQTGRCHIFELVRSSHFPTCKSCIGLKSARLIPILDRSADRTLPSFRKFLVWRGLRLQAGQSQHDNRLHVAWMMLHCFMVLAGNNQSGGF